MTVYFVSPTGSRWRIHAQQYRGDALRSVCTLPDQATAQVVADGLGEVSSLLTWIAVQNRLRTNLPEGTDERNPLLPELRSFGVGARVVPPRTAVVPSAGTTEDVLAMLKAVSRGLAEQVGELAGVLGRLPAAVAASLRDEIRSEPTRLSAELADPASELAALTAAGRATGAEYSLDLETSTAHCGCRCAFTVTRAPSRTDEAVRDELDAAGDLALLTEDDLSYISLLDTLSVAWAASPTCRRGHVYCPCHDTPELLPGASRTALLLTFVALSLPGWPATLVSDVPYRGLTLSGRWPAPEAELELTRDVVEPGTWTWRLRFDDVPQQYVTVEPDADIASHVTALQAGLAALLSEFGSSPAAGMTASSLLIEADLTAARRLAFSLLGTVDLRPAAVH